MAEGRRRQTFPTRSAPGATVNVAGSMALVGGEGQDTLVGRQGQDALSGDPKNDHFVLGVGDLQLPSHSEKLVQPDSVGRSQAAAYRTERELVHHFRPSRAQPKRARSLRRGDRKATAGGNGQ